MGFGRNLFVSGVSCADQNNQTEKKSMTKILKLDFYQKCILIL